MSNYRGFSTIASVLNAEIMQLTEGQFWQKMYKETNPKHILEVNLNTHGGAAALMYQAQKVLFPNYIFDYYWMGEDDRDIKYQKAKELGSTIYEAGLRKNRFIGHLLLPYVFYKFMKKHKYQVIHIHSDMAYKHAMYAIPAILAGCKNIIIHSHSSGINGSFRWLKFMLHSLCKPLLKRNDSYIRCCCSKEARIWMFGEDSNDVIFINNGVDTDTFMFDAKARTHFREILKIKPDTTLIGAVGDLSFPKNPLFMIDIMKELKEKGTEKYKLLLIGGSQDANDTVRQYAVELGVEDYVIFYGTSNEVGKMLSALDIYLMPSRFEGLPVSAIEAQCNGLKCFLSTAITLDGKLLDSCSYLSLKDGAKKWADEIAGYSSSIDERDKGKQVVQDKGFDIRNTAKQLKDIYDEVTI